MSFDIMTDSGSNLTEKELQQYNIRMIGFVMTIDGEPHQCYTPGEDDEMLAKEYYRKMRQGAEMSTSLINPERFRDFFEPSLREGRDILFVGMSSGITGTLQAANVAAQMLADEYPERRIETIDSLGAGFGEGLIACRMAEYRAGGRSFEETLAFGRECVRRMRQVFTVEDLKYLRKGGRISGATALIGNVLSLKPILIGNNEGKIVATTTVRGRKRSLAYLAQECIENIHDAEHQEIAISHCDCLEDAEQLAQTIREKCNVKNVVMHFHDRCTGSHLGPGAVALFYFVSEDSPLYR